MLFTTEKTHLNLKTFVYKGLKKVVPISNHIDKFFVKRRHITAATLVCSVSSHWSYGRSLHWQCACYSWSRATHFLVLALIFCPDWWSMYFSKYAWKFSYLEFSLIAILSFVLKCCSMNLSKFQNGRPWFYCLFSLVGIVVSLRMNKLKNEKETQ
jgi:tellurite resistance protein TerC